jgi:hypothetical protein
MTKSSREQLGWEVVSSDWERFQETVEDEWGAVEPFLIRELEDASREFLDLDDFAELEDRARRIAEVVGRSPGSTERKNIRTRTLSHERTTVWTSIHAGLKSDLEAFANENDLQKWEVLTAVVREYVAGGRSQRLLNKLSPEVIDVVESGVADPDATSSDTLYRADRVKIQIAERLGQEFTEDELADAIDAETSGSDYYHERYGSEVVEWKEVKRWERVDQPDIFLRIERWCAKMTTEIIRHLGGSDESQPDPFSKDKFAKAASAAGIEVSDENRDTANEYKVRVCDRLGYRWDEEINKFAPSNDDESVGEDPVEQDAKRQMDAIERAERVGSHEGDF